jgi:hypothetical protein
MKFEGQIILKGYKNCSHKIGGEKNGKILFKKENEIIGEEKYVKTKIGKKDGNKEIDYSSITRKRKKFQGDKVNKGEIFKFLKDMHKKILQ